ncbi:CubicO group peptidase (beta-lactamase class C family) [Arthrobacter sp. SLBN-100]|uniref:serine hydrolase domain-containing protein n=1 Tax=Arthrobacter sp. SLBN-100 TaxID=2768450 RepID=UPI0011547DB2|nr:serine hydrolase domain-containing protein [Arthrobacter sp. SLBN-100]TQJ62217.1 CubicO group peptidase (beta-lactamase class C family) [Arthrobacter sp. SLBN-100]
MTNPLGQVLDWPASDVAVAVVGADGLRGHIGPNRPFPWSSVTKLITSLAVVDAAHSGFIDLDEPAGPTGSTVRHLLAHASGLAPDSDDVISAPGSRRNYSNRGIEVAADLVASRMNTPFQQVLSDRITEPLAMHDTRLHGSPAHAASGTIHDLALLGRHLLTQGSLAPHLVAQVTDVAFPGISGVLPGFGLQEHNEWGLGFEIRGSKTPHWTGKQNSPRTFGHFGQSGSFLWVDPDAGLACACLTDRPFGSWAISAWPALTDDVLTAFG